MARLHLVLPVGTHVVIRADVATETGARRPSGSTAVVIAAPDQPGEPYRLRFPDGSTGAAHRDALSIRKQHTDLPEAEPDEALWASVAYRCIVGSRAYGLDHPGSDLDRRGFFLPPAARHWSLFGIPEQLERRETDECYWELQKFLTLALKANPNVLECLYTPLVEHAVPLALELRAMRDAFLSQFVYQTYNGYVLGQFRKLEQDLRTTGEIRWKHAMHLIRLLLSGITALREGEVPLQVEAHRDTLLAIRHGTLPWAEVDAWRLGLHAEFEAAFSTTRLPERPDFARVDAFLIRARRAMADPEVRA